MKLLFGHDKVVADWASQRFGKPLRNWHRAIGIINEAGILVGCASFHDFNESNVEFSFYGPGALRASLVRELMDFAFNGLKVNRVTARTPRQNKQVIRWLPRFGFGMEGVMKHYYGPVKRLDAIVFGLLRNDAEKIIGRSR
jgi:RimJ/RimL family protein N-acetyltransferase